jgi:cytochrome c-type biogenesis protein CcmH
MAVMIALLAPLGAARADEALEARVREISAELRCPTCQAVSVNDSEAAFSVQIRDKVRHMVQEGQNAEQIKAYFVSRYGEWILRAPKKQGLGLVLWVLPGIALVGVGAWVLRHAARAQRLRAAREVPPPVSPEEQARIDRDLRRFEEGI